LDLAISTIVRTSLVGYSSASGSLASTVTMPRPSSPSLSLREVTESACKQIAMGAAVMPWLLDDEQYAATLTKHFNSIVIEHHLKWAPLCELLSSNGKPLDENNPDIKLGRYDFTHCDKIVDFAIANNMSVHGHVLIWHVTSPPCLADLSPEELLIEMRKHIFITMEHFKGKIKTWDVVNEVLAPDGSLANNVFLQKLGPSYIEQAFRFAHEADPSATLIYNDNKVEGCGLGSHSSKGDAFYNLLADLLAKNTPIHACGIQGHFNAAGSKLQRPPTPAAVANQINRLGKLGLKVRISELDVRAAALPSTIDREFAQYVILRDILTAALAQNAFDGIYFWGVNDCNSWVFDDECKAKRMFDGVVEALQSVSVKEKVYDDRFESDWKNTFYCNEDEEEKEIEGGGDAVAAASAKPDWEL
jgi:endo-1,4-beta-xylanase